MPLWIVNIQDWFLPDPLRRDPDARRRALCFVWSNLFGPPIGVVLLSFLYWREPDFAAWYVAMGGAILIFFLLPIVLKLGGSFELLSFISAQLFGAIVLFLVGVFGGVNSPFVPWFIAVVMTGCFYFGNVPRLCNPFLVCVAVEFIASYFLSLLAGPVVMPISRHTVAELGVASDLCLVVFLSNLTLNFVAIANMQQRGLEAEVSTRTLAEKRLSDALDETNQAMRSKAAFLANTSHELRTPLNAIIGFADLIRSESFGPLNNARYRDYLNDIAASGQHLLHIINDILDFSKFEAGKAALENEEPVDLSALIGAVSRMIQPQADGAEIGLVATIDQPLPPVFGNERLLSQVVLNLLSNAVKFTPPAGSVTVCASRSGDGGVAIVVRDTGIGMSEDDIKVALTAFGQVDSNLSRRFPGTGLGLPLTKAIVELHDGKLVVDSAPGRGTEMTVLLPPGRVFPTAAAA